MFHLEAIIFVVPVQSPSGACFHFQKKKQFS